MKKTLIIMRGAPGSGKTTFLKKNYPNALICSADNFFIKDGVYTFNPNLIGIAHEKCYEKFLNALKNNNDLIAIDNTNLLLKEMQRYISEAKNFGYEIKIIKMSTNLETLMGRNVHGVPDLKVEKMYHKMENIPNSWNLKEILENGNKVFNENN